MSNVTGPPQPIHAPKADSHILGPSKDVALLEGIPRKAKPANGLSSQQNHQVHAIHVPFLLLPNKPDVRFRLAVALRFAGVLRSVENQYFSRRAFGGNQVRVLRHVSCLVDFSRVNYLLSNLNLGRRRDRVTTHFPPFFVPFEWYIAFRKVERCDLKIILGLI